MATVINIAAAKPRIDALGWGNQINITDALAEINKFGIGPSSVLAYLDALIANPTGLDDQSIPGCDGATATKITGWLQKKGLIA